MGQYNSPCYQCENRFLGCHQYCEEYWDWRKLMKTIGDDRKAKNEVTYALNDMHKTRIKKTKR